MAQEITTTNINGISNINKKDNNQNQQLNINNENAQEKATDTNKNMLQNSLKNKKENNNNSNSINNSSKNSEIIANNNNITIEKPVINPKNENIYLGKIYIKEIIFPEKRMEMVNMKI